MSSSTLTMDGTGGAATIDHRIQASAVNLPILWFYLTEIFFKMTVVTAQPAELTINTEDWSALAPIGTAIETIGIPAPATQADLFGASKPTDIFLPSPKYLGQASPGIDAQLKIITANTDTGVIVSQLHGFATQKPLDPLDFYR